jgi:hypothetical protein
MIEIESFVLPLFQTSPEFQGITVTGLASADTTEFPPPLSVEAELAAGS